MTDAQQPAAQLWKYPRTHHLEGSRFQPGDDDLDCIPFEHIRGLHLVVEEKVDGGNAGISFGASGELLLQSRGHFLRGGPRERHFHLLKAWANRHRAWLWRTLATRYVLYGEWLYAKHTVFYDALPHYLLEFDVLDRETGAFLATGKRRALLAGGPVASVPVLHEGPLDSPRALAALVGPSTYKRPRWRERLREQAAAEGFDVERALRETDASDDMEGLYVKVEDEASVVARYKYIRATYLQTVVTSGTHWLDRPLLPNRLADGVDLFAEPS